MFNFKYNIFVIDIDSPQKQSINTWLLEECKSQWFEVVSNGNTMMKFHSPAKFESPLKINYPTTNHKTGYVRIIGIEDDDEATRFKLIYQGDQE